MFKRHIGRQWLLCLVLAVIVTGTLVIFPKADTEGTSGQFQESNVKTKYIYEDNDKIVTAILQNANSVPDNAVLCVETITQESSPNQYSQLEFLVSDSSEKQTSDDITGYDFCAYDIHFLFKNKEIEPADGSVTVTIKYKEQVFDSIDDSDIAVYHVIGNGSDALLSSVDTNANLTDSGSLDSVEFETNSFSVFLVTNGYTKSSSLNYNIIDNSNETFTNTPYYDPNCVLGIAGNFHIVAFGTARLNTHTNGNVLAYNLYANGNFGTKDLTNELSYVQNYLKVSSSSASSTSHVLAVGSSNTVSLTDNGNAFTINNTKLDTPKTVYQDNDTGSLPFINLNTVKTDIAAKSTMMGAYANANINNSHLSTSGGSCDASYLTLTDTDGIGVYSISGAALNSYSYMGIKGFTSGNDGSVIINVNCTGLRTVTIPNALMYIDGVAQATKEVTTFADGKIIWNFINASGVTITSQHMTGTIIAVGATVIISQNLNGSVIAENINVNAESHRTDFTGKISDDITVKKVWKDATGNIMSGSQISGLSATVQLYDNGAPLSGGGYTTTLNASNGWSYTWADLPSIGHAYSIREVSIYNGFSSITVSTNNSTGASTANGYQISYNNNAGITTGTITVTNGQSNETVVKTVTKIWNDNNNQSGIRPASITVQLMANGSDSGSSVTLNAASNWSYTWSGLQKYKTGTAVVYTVKEVGIVTGYTANYSADTFTITNSLETVVKTVTEIWSDNNNQSGIRPASITIQLMANGSDFGSTVTLNATNNWSYTWSSLQEYINGTAVVYTVKEVGTVNGYTVSYSTDTFTITNSLTYYGFNVQKVSSESVSLTLPGAEFKLEKLTVSNTVDPLFTAITVSTGSGGMISFSNLTAGTYRLTETAAPTGYNLSDIVITVTIDSGGITAEGDCKVNTAADGKVTLVIENTPGFVLPETGGLGSRLFMYGGLTLVLIAAMLLAIYFVKRKITERRYIK